MLHNHQLVLVLCGQSQMMDVGSDPSVVAIVLAMDIWSLFYIQKFATLHIWKSKLRWVSRSGLTPDHSHPRPADVLVTGWEKETPSAYEVTAHPPPHHTHTHSP